VWVTITGEKREEKLLGEEKKGEKERRVFPSVDGFFGDPSLDPVGNNMTLEHLERGEGKKRPTFEGQEEKEKSALITSRWPDRPPVAQPFFSTMSEVGSLRPGGRNKEKTCRGKKKGKGRTELSILSILRLRAR